MMLRQNSLLRAADIITRNVKTRSLPDRGEGVEVEVGRTKEF